MIDMTARGEYAIADLGTELVKASSAVADISRHYNALRDARESLMRTEAALQHLVGVGHKFPFYPLVVAERLRLAWQCVAAATKEADAAITILHCPLGEVPSVSARHFSHDGGGTVSKEGDGRYAETTYCPACRSELIATRDDGDAPVKCRCCGRRIEQSALIDGWTIERDPAPTPPHGSADTRGGGG